MKAAHKHKGVIVFAILMAMLPRARCAEVAMPELSDEGFAAGQDSGQGASQTPGLNRFGLSVGSEEIPDATSGGTLESLAQTPKPARIIGTGQKTSSNKGFNWPIGVALDSKQNLYVMDAENKRVQILNSKGKYLRTLKGKKIFEDKNRGFGWPYSAAVSPAGTIYVVGNHHRVLIYGPRGNYLRTLGSGQQTSGNEGFNEPDGIAIDAKGNVYVADKHNQRVQIFDAQDNYLGTLGTGKVTSSDQGFSFPRDVAIDKHGNIYVLDMHRARIFDAQGNYLRSLDRGPEKSGEDLEGIAVDDEGRVYIAGSDPSRSFVQIFDAQGNFIRALGMGGNDNLHWPSGVAVGRDGTIYVADKGNHRVAIFHPIALETARLKRELEKTIEQTNWDGESGGGRFKIWDASLGGVRP